MLTLEDLEHMSTFFNEYFKKLRKKFKMNLTQR